VIEEIPGVRLEVREIDRPSRTGMVNPNSHCSPVSPCIGKNANPALPRTAAAARKTVVSGGAW